MPEFTPPNYHAVRSGFSDGDFVALDVGPRAARERVRAHPDPWVLACVGSDATVLAGAALLLALTSSTGAASAWLVVVPVATFLVLLLGDLSRPRLRVLVAAEVGRMIKVAAVVTMAAALAAILAGADARDVEGIVGLGLIAGGALALERASLAVAQAAVRRRRGPTRRTLIIGAGRIGRLAAKRLEAHPTLGLRPIGFLDKEPLEVGGSGPGLPVLGASWDLARTIEEQRVETVVVAFSTAPSQVPLGIVRRCWEMGVSVVLIPRLFEVQGVRTTSEHIGGLPLIMLNPANPRGWELRVRYAVDRLVAAIALVVLAPLLLGVALAVRLSMGSPVLFRQARVGRDGHVFDMLKFRTMSGEPRWDGENDARWAADAMAPGAGLGASTAPSSRAAAVDEGGAATAEQTEAAPAPLDVGAGASDADRRTPLGRVVRRWSVDELPQLLNVVRGDMALIGPRPERVHYADEFERAVYRYRDRARIKPGITGWAQVHGLRGETSLADRVEWDNFYIENWSPLLDVKILLLTVIRALRDGA
jgi:exopolysaccharide biosynthesis polyprenyl glycosylphosphotransferase